MDPVSNLRGFLSGGVLAGGLGLRAGGADKGWRVHDGRPLIEWVVQTLKPQVSELLVSANRNLDDYARLADRVVRDDQAPGQGPLAGMVTLLRTACRPWLLCVPCDVPGVPAQLGLQLWQRAEATGADIAVMRDAQGWHPTFCLLRTDLADDARDAFEAGERAPRRWFARHRVTEWQAPAPLNLNTPAGTHALE